MPPPPAATPHSPARAAMESIAHPPDPSAVDDDDDEQFAPPNMPDHIPRTTEELKPHEKNALLELRAKLEEAIHANQLLCKQSPGKRGHHRRSSSTGIIANGMRSCLVELNYCSVDLHAAKEDVSLWGIPLLPSRGHEGTDVILLKFLRAREFRVPDAFEMLQRTLQWRRDYGIDGILDEDLGSEDFVGTAHLDRTDREGHPVCYNNYGAFIRNKELYQKTFGNDERRERFLRWRVQSMERDIQQLSFKPGGVGSMIQITDLKNSLNPNMKELRHTTKKIISLFQDNYPEFVKKNIIINVSLRYYAYHALLTPHFSQRERSKFIFARPSKVFETLLKYIAPENIPVEYGGFKREDDDKFSAEDGGVSEMPLRPGPGWVSTVVIQTPKPGVTLVWDLTVVGWEVHYKEEFIPDDEGSYRVLISKERKLEESTRNSFYISEPGRVALAVENRTLKRKMILYRSKSIPTIPLYNLGKHTHHHSV